MSNITPEEYITLIEVLSEEYPSLSKAAIMQIVIELTRPAEEDDE